MTLGLLDLSIVTEQLISQFKLFAGLSQLYAENKDTTRTSSGINVTGLAPDAARKTGGCQLSIFLFHVAADPSNRNTYPGGGRPQRVPLQPLALTLHYLVTAYSDDITSAGYVDEQQAMSIALQFFHENPRITAVVPLGAREQVLTVTFEPQTMDEVARIWQGLAQPLRLSAVYRAAVVLLEPPSEPLAPKPPPKEVRVEGLSLLPDSTIAVDAGGLAIVSASGAGFEPGRVSVFVHGPYGAPGNITELVSTNANPPPPGAFVVLDENRLLLRVKTNTKPHGYQLLVRPEAKRPPLAFWLVVSEVTVDRERRAKVRSDGAGFGAGTTVTLRNPVTDPAVDVPLALGGTPPGDGEFHVVDGDQLEFKVPAGTAAHGYQLLVLPAAGAPVLTFWLVVP